MKTVIIFHLFYLELWEEFKTKLLNLNDNFDLIVTIPDNKLFFQEIIKKSFPNATIFSFPNKGLDIGPFLKILKHLKENKLKYDYLVKIHTKKSTYNTNLGTIWRNDLVNSIIGNKEKFENNLNILKDNEFKMCGSKNWLLTASIEQFNKTFELTNLKNGLAKFIGGTMFIVDYNVLLNSFTIEQLDTLYEKMPTTYKRDHTPAHDMERIFGFVVQNKGYKIIGV